MEKSVNLTVRLSEKLKADADAACAYLDLTVSEVIRKALRDVVAQHQLERAQETKRARDFSEGDLAQAAYDALNREIMSKGGAVDVVQVNGVTELRPSVADRQEYRQVKAGGSMSPRLNDAGDFDPSTLPRKLRRQWERDKSKGRV